MQLTRQQFAELIEELESKPDPHEVRRASRLSIRRQVTIVSDADNRTDEKAVVLQDISRRGVSMTYHEAMPRGKRFLLLFAANGQNVELPCVVRNCEMVKQHLFRIGAEFENATQSEQMPSDQKAAVNPPPECQ